MRNYGYSEEGDTQSIGDLRLWRRILGYCSDHATGLSAAVVLSLVVTAATLLLPRLMQIGIDRYIMNTGLPTTDRVAGLGHICFYYGLLVAAIFLITFLQILLLEWIGQVIMHRLRQNLFSHLLLLDLSFFHNQPAGRLVTRLTNDIQNMHEMFTSVMITLFNDGLKLIGIFCFLMAMNSRLALVMTLFVPLAVMLTVVFSRLAREKFRAIRVQLAKINAFLAESISGISILQIFNHQQRSIAQCQALTQEYLKRTLAQIRLFGTFMPLTELMSSMAIALIIWYGGGEVIQRSLTLGELAAFLAYMRLFFQPLREISQKYSIVQSAMASAERIFQTLDTSCTLRPLEPILTLPELSNSGEVVFQDLVFSYTPEQPIFQKMNLTIRSGETVALVGATGAGKSTLISLLLRFYDPQEGRVLVGGQDIRQWPLTTLRQRIGVIMQEVFILPGTVAENIILDGEPDATRLQQLLQQTGMDFFINKLPDGLHTRIGEGALHLSLGEKQLLSFLRVLYRDPALLVLDEATASIDTESENMLEQAVALGFQGRTSLVVAHRLSTIRRVDRIIVMDQGRIVEEGSHDVLMAQNSWYRELVALDQQQSAPA